MKCHLKLNIGITLHYVEHGRYETAESPSVRPSVCLSVPSFAAEPCGGGFAAERRADRRYRWTAAVARCPAAAANASSVTCTSTAHVWETGNCRLSEIIAMNGILRTCLKSILPPPRLSPQPGPTQYVVTPRSVNRPGQGRRLYWGRGDTSPPTFCLG